MDIVIDISGSHQSGKTTVGELIYELFELYGLDIKMEGDTSTKKSKRERTIEMMNKINSITIVENHSPSNKFIKHIKKEFNING